MNTADGSYVNDAVMFEYADGKGWISSSSAMFYSKHGKVVVAMDLDHFLDTKQEPLDGYSGKFTLFQLDVATNTIENSRQQPDYFGRAKSLVVVEDSASWSASEMFLGGAADNTYLSSSDATSWGPAIF